jgi:hypothetical protein
MPRFEPSFHFSLACMLVLAMPANPEELERTFAAKEPGKLTIELDRGSVAIFAHDAPEVRVQARLRGVGASSVRLRTRQQGGQVVLQAEPEPWLALMRSRPGVRVRAWVPAHYQVEVRGGEGVEVESAPGIELLRAATGPRH